VQTIINVNSNFLLIGLVAISSLANAQIYSGQKGTIKLTGEAPQETITAESTALVGKLDVASKKFNFRQSMNTFSFSQGDLQKKHAEESFWEVERYPYATFSGEVINDTDLAKDGTYNVTVRGKFSLHGVDKELKFPAVITMQNGTGLITTKFSIFLSDYNIKIPRLVTLKVAPEFTVDVVVKLVKT
jgi:polyisoprenoid-binding protein YceI